MFQISSLKIYFIYKSIELCLFETAGWSKVQKSIEIKIRFLKKPDGWPGPARAFHVRASPHGPARAGRAFFQPGLARAGLSKTARAGPGGPCANTIIFKDQKLDKTQCEYK